MTPATKIYLLDLTGVTAENYLPVRLTLQTLKPFADIFTRPPPACQETVSKLIQWTAEKPRTSFHHRVIATSQT